MNFKWNDKKTLALLSLAIVLGLLITVEAFSSTSTDLDFNGTKSIEMSSAIYRQETSTEYYESTCSREVATGSHEVCSSGRTERRCRKVPGVGDECWDETEEICSTETTYETETYSCTLSRDVTINVFDYTLKTKLNINKSTMSSNFDLKNCKLHVTPNKFDESYEAICPTALVKLLKVDRKESGLTSQNEKVRVVNAEIDFMSFNGLEAIKYPVFDLKFNQQYLEFYASDLKNLSNFKMNLKIVRNRFLLKDKILFSKEINPSKLIEIGSHPENLEIKKWAISLKDLMGGIDSSKKHTLSLTLGLVTKYDLSKVINNPRPIDNQTKSIIVNE